MSDRRVDFGSWAYGPIIVDMAVRQDGSRWPHSGGDFLLLDMVAVDRDPGPPNGDPYCAYAGFFDHRKHARRAARRIVRSEAA